MPWYAEPWPTRLAIWAAALAGVVGAGTLLALIAVAAMAWAFVTPADSGASPQRLNVSQVEDRANGEAYVALGGDVVGASGEANVPGEMLVAAEFADRPTVTLPWSTDRLLTAPVAAATDSTPLATMIEDRIV